MAHYAWLDENNTVIHVQAGLDETELLDGEAVDWEQKYLELAVQFSPNVVDVKFFEHDEINPGSRRLRDILPRNSRKVLRPDPTQIIVIPPEDFE